MKKRIISSIIGGGLMLMLAFKGGPFLDIAWFIASSIMLFELVRMVIGKFDALIGIPSLVFLAVEYYAVLHKLTFTSLITPFYLIMVLILNVIFVRRYNLEKICLAIVGSLYIVKLTPYLILLSDIDLLVFFVSFIVAWSYDTFAYFVGVKWGRRRPWADLSPKKSIEGVIGGVIGSVMAIAIFAYLNRWNVVAIVGYAVVAVLLAQCGDLIESAFKRTCKVKDSGTILPGHGGLLDRFDSVLPILPWTYLIFGILKLQ